MFITKQQNDSIKESIRQHLQEAYSLSTCCNGPYGYADHDKVLKAFERFAKRVLDNKLI